MRTHFSSGGPFEDTYGYSRAVRVGNTIAVSGTCARGEAVQGDAYVQMADALRIVGEALSELGASLNDVVRTVTFVTDMGDMDLVAKAHREAFGDVRPAATIVQVAAFADPAYKIEVQVDAIVEN